MMLIIISLLILYNMFVLLLIVGWLSTQHSEHPVNSPNFFYSIIIPFRNEVKNLPRLLRSVAQLKFASANYEVIFVNDHSDDGSVGEIMSENIVNGQVLQLESEMGKKAALALGIERAKGDVIVTTDADCSVPGNWLGLLADFFERKSAKMVFGGVALIDSQSFFDKVQQVEFASLIGSGAATLKLGLPSMCNGANLAFLRKTFYEVDGYNDNKSNPSGDDEFLMHKIYKKYPKGVFYTKSTQSVVSTKPLESVSAFFQQRKRWASKWKSYASLKNSLLAILVLLFNVSVIAALGLLATGHSVIELVILLTVKFALELIFLRGVIKKVGSRFSIPAFIFLQICYPFYVVLFGLTANFGRYTWKGRKHKF